MSFVRDVLLKPVPLAWNGVSGAIGIGSFVSLDGSVALSLRISGAICLFLALALIGMILSAHDLYRRANVPATVRLILEGTHFYHGRLIVILDRSNWIESGQLLTLVANGDGVQVPLCLLTVETRTTEGFPQCVVAVALTSDRLSEYLSDRSRWRSLSALPEIKEHYLEAVNNG